MYGGWWLHFYSRRKQEMFYVTLPCYGPIGQTRVDAPAGRQWPSDGDQILRDSWMDSDEALRVARTAAEEKDASMLYEEMQQFELSSRAKPAVGVIRPPFRDGMFVMESSWRISFSRRSEKETRIVSVTVPAYREEKAVVEVRAFDRRGRKALE